MAKSIDITTYVLCIDFTREHMFCFVHRMGCVDDHKFKMASTAKCKQTKNITSDFDGKLTYMAKINRTIYIHK